MSQLKAERGAIVRNGAIAIARLRTVLLVVAALLFVASWPGAAVRAVAVELVAPAIPKEIAGRDGVLDVIVHAKDGPALAGARVRAFAILDGRAHAAGEAESDRDGRATLRDLPNAEHWIVAEAVGRARASQMVVVVSGERRLDLELGPEHTLDVTVHEEGGAPVNDAEIEVRGSDPFPVGARTGTDGRAHVGRLGEGPYTVVARAIGFEERTERRVAEGTPVAIVLGKQGALAVEVVGENGAPAASSRVFVGSTTLGTTRIAETNKDGKVRISGLDRGSYALRAVNGSRVSPIEVGIVLEKGEERTVTLKLGPGLMVMAHVVEAADENADVRDARVTLAEGGLSPFPLDGVTDKHGRVALGPIARGQATLSARADGFVPRTAIALDEATAGANSPPGEVKIALARGGILIGKVTDSRGYAVDGATIRVIGTDHDGMPIDEDPSRWSFREAHFAAQLKGPTPLMPAGELGVMPGPVPAIPHGPTIGLSFGSGTASGAIKTVQADPWVTGHDGEFRATPVSPGRVRAIVHHPQYVEAMSEVVLLESNKETRVDVVLQRGGTLEGHVVDTKRRPVSGAHVTALAKRGSLEHMTRSGSDGSFAFAALPDAVTILVSRDEDVTTVAARVEVNIAEGSKKTIEIALPEPRPPLPVEITDRSGRPIDAAQVSAVSLDPNEAVRVTAFTDSRGKAELAGAKGVPLRIEVSAPGHATNAWVTSEQTPTFSAMLLPAESLTGRILTRRGEPVSGATVTLESESASPRARTNHDGVFTMKTVPPGAARLRVRAPGRAPDERTITIEQRNGGRPTEVKIELAEEGVVEGTIVDGRGDPIPGARVAKDAVPTYLPVGAAVTGLAVSDGKGRFRLGELAEGVITLEAYAPDVGRTRKADVRIIAGRTTTDVKLVIVRGEAGPREPIATGGVAVTLGETHAQNGEPPDVVIVSVAEGSEAERGGLVAGDVVLEVGGAKVTSIVDARARLSGPVHDDALVKVRRGERIVPLRVAREAVRR